MKGKPGDSICKDETSGSYIGDVELVADGCGWVQAIAWSGYEGGNGFINHLQLIDASNGNVVTSAAYSGYYFEETIHIQTNGRCLYALGVIQVTNPNYWGESTTRCGTGYDYLPGY